MQDNSTMNEYGNASEQITSSDVFHLRPRDFKAAVVVTVIGIVSVIGNALIIGLYIKYKELRDKTTKFIINLGLTDLLLGLMLCVGVFLEYAGTAKQSFVQCMVRNRLGVYFTMVTENLIVVTAFERYFGICDRERYTYVMSTKASVIMLAVAWFVPLPFALLPVFGFHKWEECDVCQIPEILPNWLITVSSIFMIVETVVVTVLYIKIIIKIRKFHLRVHPAQLIGINAAATRNRRFQKSITNVKIIAIVAISFVACWLPTYVTLIVFVLGYKDILSVEGLGGSLMCIGLSNCMMNPFLYAWQRKDFRNKLKSIVCSAKRQKELPNDVEWIKINERKQY